MECVSLLFADTLCLYSRDCDVLNYDNRDHNILTCYDQEVD